MGCDINSIKVLLNISKINILIMGILLSTLTACGGGKSSGTGGGTTDSDRPAKASLISASSQDADKLTLDWYPSSDNITSQNKLTYKLHASTDPDFQPSASTQKNKTTGDLSATIEGLQAGTSYYVMVVTVDEAGNESWSNKLDAKTVSTSVVRTSNNIQVQTATQNPVAEDGKVTFEENADIPSVGTYITSSENEGYLRKVTAVTTDNNKVIATTESASLNEIFEELEISTTVKLQSPPQQATSNKSYAAKTTSTIRKAEWKNSGLTIIDPNLTISKSTRNFSVSQRNTAAKSGSTIEGDIHTIENDVIKIIAPAYVAADPGKTLRFVVKANAWDDPAWYRASTDIEICSIKFEGVTYEGDPATTLPKAVVTSNVQADEHNITTTVEWDVQQRHFKNDGNYIATFTAYADEKGDSCNGGDSFGTWEDEVTIEVPIYVTVGNPELDDTSTINYTNATGNLTVKDDVDFKFNPDFIINASIKRASLQKADLIAKANISLTNKLTITSNGSEGINKTGPLFTPKQFVKVFAAGGVPIVVRGSFGVSVQIEGNVTGEMKLEKTLEIKIPNAEFGLKYNKNAGGWQAVTDFKQTYRFEIEGEAEATANIKLTLIPDLQIHFYDAASGRMLVEPYLYGDIGLEGQFRYENGNGDRIQDPTADYWFTKLEAGAGIDLKLYAGLHIFDYNIASYPSDVKFSETDRYESFHPLPKTPIYGLPTLSANYDPEPQYSSDSRAIAIQGSATNLPNPFGGSSLNPFRKWTDAKLKTDKTGASVQYRSPGGYWLFYTEPDNYEVQLGGYSKLGWFVRQIASVNIDLNDHDNDGMADLWESKYNVSDPSADEDNDGLNNLQEFQRGKYPRLADNVQTVAGDKQVTVSWDAVADATLYFIYESTTPDFNQNTVGVFIYQTTETSKVIDGLTNGQTYYYAVVADNDQGQGALSNISAATPGADRTITSVTPETTNVYATVLQSFVVSGTNLTDNITMTLEGCPSATLQTGGTATQRTFQCVPESTGTKTGTVTDSGTSFNFSVNVETKPDFASTGAITAPTEGSSFTPTDIHVSLHAEDQDGIRKVTLVFKENTPGYTVCEDGTAIPCEGNQLSQQTHVVNPGDYGAEQGQIEIGLWVTDNNSLNYHTTLVDSITINWTSSILPAPQNVQAVAGGGEVTLSWDNVDGATGYDVCRATQTIVDPSNCYNHQGGTILLDQTSPGVITGLSNDVSYYFVVRPKNSNGSGISSTNVSAIPTGAVQPTPTGKLNDTGITLCGDYAHDTWSRNHSNSEDCANTTDAEGDPIPAGQDATTGRDANPATNSDSDGHKGFSYTKLNANGAALADQTATTFSCVKDNVTGLIWEVKTTSGLHNKSDRYSWYNTDSTTNGGSAGFENDGGNICAGYDVNDSTTYCNTQAYVARVNAAGLCGATDWRLPTQLELRSIVSYDRGRPAIDTDYFPNTISSLYWSSSPFAPSSDRPWLVYFNDGYYGTNGKDYKYYVRLVRSGQ